jgi:hypothetical protein
VGAAYREGGRPGGATPRRRRGHRAQCRAWRSGTPPATAGRRRPRPRPPSEQPRRRRRLGLRLRAELSTSTPLLLISGWDRAARWLWREGAAGFGGFMLGFYSGGKSWRRRSKKREGPRQGKGEKRGRPSRENGDGPWGTGRHAFALGPACAHPHLPGWLVDRRLFWLNVPPSGFQWRERTSCTACFAFESCLAMIV